jgi:hypothetical protein
MAWGEAPVGDAHAVAYGAMHAGMLAVARPRAWSRVARKSGIAATAQALASLGFLPASISGKTRACFYHPASRGVLRVPLHPRIGEALALEAEAHAALPAWARRYVPRTAHLPGGIAWQQWVDFDSERYDYESYREVERIVARLGWLDVHGNNFGFDPDGAQILVFDFMTRTMWDALESAMADVTGDPGGEFCEEW